MPQTPPDVPEDKRYYIGRNKPHIMRINEPYDKYSWQRRQGAIQLGLSEEDMTEEPDEMSDGSDDQGWT